jgi:outer membrane lipoprotein-sorting protein
VKITIVKDQSLSLKSLLLAWLLIVALLGCLGWADTLEGLKQATGKISSVQADFVQQKHLKILSKPLISKGVMYYKAPSSLRWEYKAPIQSVLLMQNGHTKRFQNDGSGYKEERGANMPSMQMVMAQITQWLSGNFSDDALFSAKMEKGRKIILTPQKKGFADIIARIELHLAENPGMIAAVLIFEGPDAFTRMDFNQTIINPDLPEEIFHKVP